MLNGNRIVLDLRYADRYADYGVCHDQCKLRSGSVTVTGAVERLQRERVSGGAAWWQRRTSKTIQILPMNAPPPIIAPRDNSGVNQCTSSNIAGNTQAVVVGQRIAFTACLPSIVPLAEVASQVWTYPAALAQNAVGGYNPTATNNQQVISISAPNCSGAQAFCDFPTFYWVVPGLAQAQYTFTYTYTLKNGGGSAASTIGFQVTGPTATGANGAFLTAQVGPPPQGANPAQIVSVWPPQGTNPNTRLELGDGEGGVSAGITFTVAAQAPNNAGLVPVRPGCYAGTNDSYLTNPAPERRRAGSPWQPRHGTRQLVPVPPSPSTTGNRRSTSRRLIFVLRDQEGNVMNARIAEAVFAFSANMYVMWDPALPGSNQSTCAAASNVPRNGQSNPQPSTCTGSIPVPLGYATWGFVGDTINTLNPNAAPTANTTGSANGTGWVLLICSGPTPAAPVFRTKQCLPGGLVSEVGCRVREQLREIDMNGPLIFFLVPMLLGRGEVAAAQEKQSPRPSFAITITAPRPSSRLGLLCR